MTDVADRDYLSIGEVLDLLKSDFPDVTISKIRFLESQGLLEPERTPSGYRKFYDDDVERLRWILQQQRENFLPLKVIKGKLSASPADGDPEPARAPLTRVASGPRSARSFRVDDEPASDLLTREQLAEASGLSIEGVKELVRYGLIEEQRSGTVAYYDVECLTIAGIAAAFLAHGVEARHLRMYKNSAEREASFFEQVVTPLLNKRNPEARDQALHTLDELGRLGDDLRAVLLRRALREATRR